MRTFNGILEWIESLDGAHLSVWMCRLEARDKAGKPVLANHLRARLDGVRWVTKAGVKRVADVGKSERHGVPHAEETGFELSGYAVVADLGLDPQAGYSQLVDALVLAAKGEAPTAEELAADDGLAQAQAAIARADAAEAALAAHKGTADADKARAQQLAAEAIDRAKTQAREDVKQLVIDRKAADAAAATEKKARELAEAESAKLAEEKRAAEHERDLAKAAAEREAEGRRLLEVEAEKLRAAAQAAKEAAAQAAQDLIDARLDKLEAKETTP